MLYKYIFFFVIIMNDKIFILEPRSGLCNQLNCIVIGLILGIIFDRDIYFHGFQIDYMNQNNLYDFEKIINIDHINIILNKYDIKIKIIKNLHCDINQIPVLRSNEQIKDIKDIFSHIKSFDNLDNNIINLKNPISTFIPDEFKDFFNYMKSNLKFDNKFIEISNSIKEKYELKDYCCIHLRMEDDALDFSSKKFNKSFELMNDIHKQIYINELESLKNIDVKKYICTSLVINENKNNLFYKVIKKQYDLIDKNNIINDYDLFQNELSNKRELYGIIDYIIAKDSKYFIGCDWSSFSSSIINNHTINNKDYNILNIWDQSTDINKDNLIENTNENSIV